MGGGLWEWSSLLPFFDLPLFSLLLYHISAYLPWKHIGCEVPIAAYHMSGTPEFAVLVADTLKDGPAMIWGNHGVSHIPQFTERKNRFDKRQGQADAEHVDEEVVAPGLGFAIVIRCECGEGQSPQSTERSSAWLDGQ